MSAKLVVLYPRPNDVNEFERQYHSEHLPLMRRLLGRDVPLPTYRVHATPGRETAIYRIAEIHFASGNELDAFLRNDAAAAGRESSIKVSSGGRPTFLFCEPD